MITTTPPILKLSCIDLRDQGSIAIVDLSTYLTLPTSGNFILQITPPGYPTRSVTFIPGSVNVYKCADLNIDCPQPQCCALPDGIYNVKYSVVVSAQKTEILEQSFIKIDQIKCKFQNCFIKVDMECNCTDNVQKSLKKELRNIDLLISGAVAQANECNPSEAYKLYMKADSLLDRINCQFGLPCSSVWSCPQCNN